MTEETRVIVQVYNYTLKKIYLHQTFIKDYCALENAEVYATINAQLSLTPDEEAHGYAVLDDQQGEFHTIAMDMYQFGTNNCLTPVERKTLWATLDN